MNRFVCRSLAAALLCYSLPAVPQRCLAPLCHAGEMKSLLDCAEKPKLLKTRFDRYPSVTKAIEFEPQGLHFFLSTDTRKPVQTGLASTFAVTGDFEISAAYEWTPVEVPKGGYGVSCGIAIDTDTRTVALARGNFQGKGGGYVVTRAGIVDGKKKYDNDPVMPTQAKRGQLVLRREKKEVICLTADDAGELTERCRIPFTTESVRKVRFFADPGSAPTNLDARLSQIRIRAEEITHDIPLSEASNWGWLLGATGFVLLAAITLVLVHRVWKGQWVWSRRG
jgi:hypothetical protein